jgi:hypothetical protein
MTLESKRNNNNYRTMGMNVKERTREEVLAWLQQARERKDAFQRETNEWWQARQRGLKEAEESGYYDLETV